MSDTKTYVCHVCDECSDGESCHSTVELGSDDPTACLYGLTMVGTDPSKWEATNTTDLQEINRKVDEILTCLMEGK